jgi:hypothetical protein
MRGVGFYDTGHRTPRTRDHSRDHEVVQQPPKSATAILADHWEAYEENWKTRIAREDAEKLDEQRQRLLREQAEADRRRRRGIFEFNEQMEQQIYDEAGLTSSERAVVNNILMDRNAVHDLEMTKIEAMTIVAQRKLGGKL